MCERIRKRFLLKGHSKMTYGEGEGERYPLVFRTQVSINDGAFLGIYLTAYYFRNKNFIINVRMGYIQASNNIEILKTLLRGTSYPNY